MRYFVVVLMGLVLTSVVMAEHARSGYYRRGGSVVYSSPFTTQQQYTTNSQYIGGHNQGYSQFNNRWNVGRQYQVDAYGNPVASGSLGTSGAAERVYEHNNNSQTLHSIETRENAIQQHHIQYLDQTQRNYGAITQNHIQNAQLQQINTPRAREIIQSNNQFNDTFHTLNRINAMMHQSEMNGTARYLPPVR